MKRSASQILFSCAAFVLALVIPTFAAQKATRIRPPDVLILAYGTPDGYEQVGFTYPNTVPHAQVQRDLNALQAATKQTFKDTKITDMPPPVRGSKKKMTSVEFLTSGAISDGEHGFAVEPIIQAFKPYQHVALTYFASPTFDFQGIRNYNDKFVNIAFDQHGTTYTYHIRILNSHFGHLNLPTYQPAPDAVHSVQQPAAQTTLVAAHHRQTQPWMFALVALVALGTGIIVYVVMARNV